jgi:hypothetical protein
LTVRVVAASIIRGGVADKRVAPVIVRLQWIKLASGLIALALVAAIWVVWRWQG